MRRRKQRQRGTGSIIRLAGSRNWYILYRVNGRQIRETSGSPTKQVAIRLLQKRLGEREQGLPSAQELRRLRYEDIRQALVSDYELRGRHMLYKLADGSYRIDGLPHLDKFFKGRSAAMISTQDIRAFILSRQKEGAQPGTINRNLALLRRMLNLARKEGRLRTVPYFPMLKENPARKGFLTHEQFGRLYDALPEYVQPLVALLFWAGCRLGEARQIEWQQVDLTRRQITLQGEQTKNSEPRILPLPDQLVMLLRAVRRKQGRVFFQGEFRRSWMSACQKAGLGKRTKTTKGWYRYEGLIVHDLRRSAVRNLREAGVQESVIMRITGHKTRAVFDRYSIVSTEDLQRAMQRVQRVAQVVDVPALPKKFDTSLIQAKLPREGQGRLSDLD